MIQRMTRALKFEVQDDMFQVPHLKKVIQKAQDQLSIFTSLIPSDGLVTMKITAEGDHYNVLMTLASLSLKFSLASMDTNPVKAFEEVMEEAKKKINEWKQKRTFKEEAP